MLPIPFRRCHFQTRLFHEGGPRRGVGRSNLRIGDEILGLHYARYMAPPAGHGLGPLQQSRLARLSYASSRVSNEVLKRIRKTKSAVLRRAPEDDHVVCRSLSVHRRFPGRSDAMIQLVSIVQEIGAL